MDQGFPAGQIKLMLRVTDALRASTEILTDGINVSSTVVKTGPGGRRLLAAEDFFEQAKAKVAGALKTFRADKLNQLANSVATHTDGGGLGPVDASSMKGALMASLSLGIDKAVKSSGFACESFGAGKSVTSNAGQLNGGAVGSSAKMLKSMVAGGMKGGINMACATSAASMMVVKCPSCTFMNSSISFSRSLSVPLSLSLSLSLSPSHLPLSVSVSVCI
jgi:hypothetical protein